MAFLFLQNLFYTADKKDTEPLMTVNTHEMPVVFFASTSTMFA
jgi:hypothetical protein